MGDADIITEQDCCIVPYREKSNSMGDADIITEQDCCIVPYREKTSCSASTTDGWMSRINNTQVYIS